MSNDDVIVSSGVVTEALRAGTFRVQLEETNHEVLAHLSGKMRKNRIRVIVGDRVQVEISPYDLSKARLTYRWK